MATETDVDKKSRYLSMIKELTENFPVCNLPKLIVARNRLGAATKKLIEAIDWWTDSAVKESEEEFDRAFEEFYFAMRYMRKHSTHHIKKVKAPRMQK